MRYVSFRIINFRGIKDTTINLSDISSCHINALVGLNESGKTTVLEAIHHFLSNPDLSKKVPSKTGRTEKDYQRMLPISVRAIFNGSIKIIANIEVENKDKLAIDHFLKKEFGFKSTIPTANFSITHELTFHDTKHESTSNKWSILFSGSKSTRKNSKFESLEGDAWLKAAMFVQEILPKIVYFPSALFQFPERIMLEKANDGKDFKEPKNDFYCGVLEDVLQSINPDLKLETHLLKRFKSTSEMDLQNLDALLMNMGRHLKKTVFSEWKKIFAHTPDYDFKIRIVNDEGQAGLEIKISTNEGLFSINERSAGFRWFFAFIMITRYRLNRKDRVLFLFDEPAANLHPNAQTQLIKSFELLAEHSDIVYSTHSHYLINPLWLESTSIVQNAVSEKDIDSNPIATSITVTPYRRFVGSHPDQYYYYQPIHTALDYSPSPLEFPNSVILVEGKTDFFVLKYLGSILSEKLNRPILNIFPGGGAGSLDALIALLYGWGKDFVIMLDADIAGDKQKARYKEKFEKIVEGRMFTLEDINPEWKSYQVEKLFELSDIEAIRTNCFPERAKMNKKQFHLAIQELIFNKTKISFSQATIERFIKIFDHLELELVLRTFH